MLDRFLDLIFFSDTEEKSNEAPKQKMTASELCCIRSWKVVQRIPGRLMQAISIETLFCIDHLFRHSSVDGNVFAINEIVVSLAEKQTGACNVLRFAHPFRGMLCMVFGA